MIDQLFEDRLRQCGFSVTPPRRAVFSVLRKHGMLAMSELIAECALHDRASIYRSVAVLEKSGITQRVPQGFRYKIELTDSYMPHHHHLTCSTCGRTVDIEGSELENLLKDMSAAEGFTLQRHTIELQGTCNQCARST